MGGQHARMFANVPGANLVAACDVNAERAGKFAQEFNIPNASGSVAEVLALPGVDAVSIVTPDAFHTEVTLQALAAGKHVLCEKPLAVNHPDAMRMVAAAKQSGLVNMVNFSYRDWPAIQGVQKVVSSGQIGEVRHVEASYLQAWLVSKAWGDWRTSPGWLWRLSSRHGSKGVLGDVGVHILDFATYPVGPIKEVYCRLETFNKAPGNRVGEYKLDANDSAVMTVQFANGALGSIHTSRFVGGHNNRLHLKIAGTAGTVEIDSDRSTTSYRICSGRALDTAEWREVERKPVPNMYRRFVDSIRTGVVAEPTFARGAEVQKLLDICFESDATRAPVQLKPARKA